VSDSNNSLKSIDSKPIEIRSGKQVNPSIISDIFEGTLESKVRCLNCHEEFVKEEKFFDLSIPIDKKNKTIDNNLKRKDRRNFESLVESFGNLLRYELLTAHFSFTPCV